MTLFLRSSLVIVGLLLGLAASGSQAQAGFYKVKFIDVSPGNGVDAGQYNWQLWNSTGTTHLSDFAAFCVETNQYINFGAMYDLVTSPNTPAPGDYTLLAPGTAGLTTAANATTIREMWAQYRGTLGSDSAKNAAFQFAVWHFANQPFVGSPAGSESTVGTEAYWYDQFVNHITTTDKADLAVMHSDTNQDQLVEVGGGGGGDLQIVPAPPALFLALAGLLPCFALRRRLIGKTV